MLDPQVAVRLLKQNLAPIQQHLDDKTITEIMINPGGDTYVERSGVIEFIGAPLNESAISVVITAIGKYVKQDVRPDSLSAIVNASIDDMRIAGGLKGISPNGSFLTIRKHQDSADRPTLDKLVEWGAITREQADLLAQLVLVEKKNCLIAGGTGSGKTTLLNALLQLLPGYERIMSIEDAREIQVKGHFIPLLTNAQKGITAREQVKLAMRSRPDRLLLGETRGDETYDLIRALNSGHPGSMSTIHGDSAEEAMGALEMLFQMSLPSNASIPIAVARGFIANAIKVVVFVSRSVSVDDKGVARVVRKVKQILLIKGVKNGNYQFEVLGKKSEGPTTGFRRRQLQGRRRS